MPQYRVTWNVVVDARSEEEAAREAERLMRQRGQRTYFVERYPSTGRYLGAETVSVYVDLDFAATGPYEAPRDPRARNQPTGGKTLMDIFRGEERDATREELDNPHDVIDPDSGEQF